MGGVAGGSLLMMHPGVQRSLGDAATMPALREPLLKDGARQLGDVIFFVEVLGMQAWRPVILRKDVFQVVVRAHVEICVVHVQRLVAVTGAPRADPG